MRFFFPGLLRGAFLRRFEFVLVCFAACVCRARSSRLAAMRFSNSAAGSSFGSWEDKLAGECVAENGLAQRLRTLQLGFEVGFEVVDDGDLVFDGLDDGFLFGQRRQGNGCPFYILLVDTRLIDSPLRILD